MVYVSTLQSSANSWTPSLAIGNTGRFLGQEKASGYNL